MRREYWFLQKTNGLVMLLMLVVAVVMTATVFRPHRPSPFSAGSGFGTGYGTDSIMVGAKPTRGAAH